MTSGIAVISGLPQRTRRINLPGPPTPQSFDVVFHVGGINFFNDRGKAIREMIRVAKAGSKILIADETEEHMTDMYERGPITNRFFKDRKEPVAPPFDLVPPEMEEKHLELLKPMGENRFYVLTFRKPARQRFAARTFGQDDGAMLEPFWKTRH